MPVVQQNIWILCPKHHEQVAGYYETDSLGRYLLDQHGKWVIQRTHCFNRQNTCPYTSCVLNRNCRSLRGAYYPTKILPMGN